MKTTVKDLRLGSRLLLGRYSVSAVAEPQPITWLKATPNCDFMTEFAIDFLCFDATERHENETSAWSQTHPTADWGVSNVFQYLNSEEDEWYHPLHDADAPPKRGYFDVGYPFATYAEHYGFLKYFEDYELEVINEQLYTVNGTEHCSRMRLLSCADFNGGDHFKIFNSRGVRAHPSKDLQRYKGMAPGAGASQFMEYYLMEKEPSTRYHHYVKTINRTGYLDHAYASNGSGIRPVCRVSPDTAVEELDNGLYTVAPFEVFSFPVGTDDELMALLGLV